MRTVRAHGTVHPQLVLATASAAFDNLLAGPLLAAVARSYDLPLADVATVASGYFVAYGLAQLAWARASDRFGRVVVIRTGLLFGAGGAALAALPGPLWALVGARVGGAAMMASVVPASLTYVGERTAARSRGRAASTLVAAYAAGTASAAVTGGALAATGHWRTALGISAALLATSAAASFTLERDGAGATTRSGLVETVRAPRVAQLLALGFLWGAVMLGGLALLVPALMGVETEGVAAGTVLGVYGLSVVVATRLSRGSLDRLSAAATLVIGGGLVAGGFALAATGGPAGALAAALVLATGFTFVHPTLIAWAITLHPVGPGSSVGLLATTFFCGQATATQLLARTVEKDPSSALLGLALLAGCFTVLAGTLRGTYDRRVTGAASRAAPTTPASPGVRGRRRGLGSTGSLQLQPGTGTVETGREEAVHEG